MDKDLKLSKFKEEGRGVVKELVPIGELSLKTPTCKDRTHIIYLHVSKKLRADFNEVCGDRLTSATLRYAMEKAIKYGVL